MRADRKATNEWVMGATYLGTVTAICHLRERGHDIGWIARQTPTIQKECGNAAIRAAGLNGGDSVQSLHDYIRTFAVGLAQQLDRDISPRG
jgi:hypothetical protein